MIECKATLLPYDRGHSMLKSRHPMSPWSSKQGISGLPWLNSTDRSL